MSPQIEVTRQVEVKPLTPKQVEQLQDLVGNDEMVWSSAESWAEAKRLILSAKEIYVTTD